MKFNWIIVKSGDIASERQIKTETLDPVRLQQAQRTIARAKQSTEPIPVSGDDDNPVYFGLGVPQSKWLSEAKSRLTEEQYQKLSRDLDEKAPAMRKTHFYLQHVDHGPMYHLIEADTPTVPQEIMATVAGSRFHDYVYNNVKGPAKGPEGDAARAEDKKHFQAVAQQVWEARPAVYTARPWSDSWDEYATYLGAAMFLNLEAINASS